MARFCTICKKEKTWTNFSWLFNRIICQDCWKTKIDWSKGEWK